MPGQITSEEEPHNGNVAVSYCEGEALDNSYLNQTLWDLFSTTAADYPDRDAIISMWQTDTHDSPSTSAIPPGGLGAVRIPNLDPLPPPPHSSSSPQYIRWTYKELHHRTTVLSSWLSAQGCKTGDRVGAFLWNSVEWGLVFWASAKLGMVYMPLDPRLLASEGEFLVKSTTPSVVVAQDATEAAALAPILSSSAKTKNDTQTKPIILIQCSGPPLPGWTLLQDILAVSDKPANQDITPANLEYPSNPDSHETESSSTALIIFTSGTTSTPKGCVHTHANLVAQINNYDPHPDGPAHIDRWLVHTPSCHIFAVNNALRAFKQGHCVIFPSKAFDIAATLDALTGEKATIMSAVPTLVKALLGNPAFPGKEKLSLELVTIGGTIITPEDIRLCKEGLGAKDAIQAFGMSEGAPVISWCRPDELLAKNGGHHPGVGKTLPGAKIKICGQGTREVVPRGETGELHIGGEQVIRGYLDDVGVESFYEDDQSGWLLTGDQAKMDDEGVVYILGRYKDLIIRAGENMSPLKLEQAIGEVEGVQLAQVVGVSDELAGQVPVAVVKVVDGKTVEKRDIMAKCRELGAIFALDGVYFLSELGMESFPVTSLGKIKKEVLKNAITELRMPLPGTEESTPALPIGKDREVAQPAEPFQSQPEPLTTSANGHTSINGINKTKTPSSIADQLATIWEDLIGQKPDPDDSVATFADSITILRFCDRVLNALDQRLYLQDFADHDTVNKQAALLEQRSKGEITAPSFRPSFPGAPDGVFSQSRHPTGSEPQLHGWSPSTYDTFPALSTRAFASSQIPQTLAGQESRIYESATQAAAQQGFPPREIEDVLRIRESYLRLAVGTRPQSYHIRAVFKISRRFSSPQNIRRALEAGLTAWPVFRTMLAYLPDESPFHVVLKPSDTLFDELVRVVTVPSEEARDKLLRDGSEATHSEVYMTRFDIIMLDPSSPAPNHNGNKDGGVNDSASSPSLASIKHAPDSSPKDAVDHEILLSATYNHSVADALSLLSWHLDLERLLLNPSSPLPTHTPYQPFTELYHLYQSSLPACLSVEFTVSRLRGISRFQEALFPKQRAPGWYITDDGCSPSISSLRNSTREKLWGGKWETHYQKEYHSVPRVGRNLSLSGIDTIKQKKKIEPSLVMKTAIAIFNVLQTGSEYAIFSTVHAGRSWPFVPDWLAKTLPPAMSVAGPMTEWSPELCNVSPATTTVGELLERIKRDHELLEKHCHAPWGAVLQGLGGGEESAVAQEASVRQGFVWDVSIGLGVAGGLDPTGNRGKQGGKVMEAVGRYDWPDW